MQPSFLFRVFVSSWLPLLWMVAGLAQEKASEGYVGAPFDPLVLSLSKDELAQGKQAGEYVGAQACASCHTQVHDTWTAGRHSKMIQPATPATVKADFSRSGETLQGRRYGFRAVDGQYFITESELTGKPQEHRVEFTLGSRRVQHYLTTIDKGRIIVLAPSWDVQRGQWFHNVEIIRPDEDDRQVVQQWNKSCVGCHVSRQDNAYDPATRAYHTEWIDFGTSCERCHGPGKAHTEKYGRTTQNTLNTQSKPFSADSAPGAPKLVPATPSEGGSSALIVRPTRLDPNTSSMVCGQCHSLRTAINPEYKAGDDYYDYFVPALEYAPYARPHASQDPPYWADGRPRRFSNDAIGLWESACFLRGGATCTTCHTNPHLPDVDKNPQLGGSLVLSSSKDEPSARGSTGSPRAELVSNMLCTKCHQEIGAKVTAHTRHKADSAGSACVECHMPKTVVSIKSTMRDHTIGVPAPENTVRFNIPNACSECHRDKPASWAADTLKTWSPQGKRVRLVAQAEAFSAARAGRADALDGLLAIANDEQRAPLIRANAIGYLGRFADPRAVSAIVRGTAASHPAIRAIAIAALRETGRGDAAARSAVLAALTDPRRAVRIAALLTLVEQGRTDLSPGDLARFRYVGEELTAWTRVNQQDPELQRVQGVVHLLSGDFARASAALQASFDLEPDAPSVRFFLGVAKLGQRRVEEARTLLQQVPKSDPYYAAAQEQLKKLPQ
jgi:Flp pilus assembly protein TadD